MNLGKSKLKKHKKKGLTERFQEKVEMEEQSLIEEQESAIEEFKPQRFADGDDSLEEIYAQYGV